MARLRCETCEVVLADVPEAQARHVARSICWHCQPLARVGPRTR